MDTVKANIRQQYKMAAMIMVDGLIVTADDARRAAKRAARIADAMIEEDRQHEQEMRDNPQASVEKYHTNPDYAANH